MIRQVKNDGRQAERGSTVVEFALVGMAFLGLLIGTIDVGRAVMAYSTLSSAAREATRHAIVHGARATTSVTADDVEAYALQKMPGLGSATITTTWDPDNSEGSEVTVNIQYNYKPIVGFLPSVPLSARSRMIVSY